MTKNPKRTSTGRVLSDDEIDQIADEVSRNDADIKELRTRKRGRPLAGIAPGEVVAVRMEPSLRASLARQAAHDASSVSEVVRSAVVDRLSTTEAREMWRLTSLATEAAEQERPVLPNRSRSHQISTESETEFKRLTELCGWQFHASPQQEYGVDGTVEIFDEAGFTTGLRFNVQLKSTDGSSWRVPNIKHSTFNYWAQLAEPVLLVRYNAASHETRCQWVGWRRGSFSPGSVSFMLTEGDRWDSEKTPKDIFRHVLAVRRLNQPLPFSIPLVVDLQTDGISRFELLACLSSASDQLGLRFDLSPSRGEALGVVSVHADRADIDTGFNPIGMGYEAIPSDGLAHWAAAVVLTVAAAFAENGRDEALLRVLEVDEYEDFVAVFAGHNLDLLAALLTRRCRADLAVRLSGGLRALGEDGAALDLLVEVLRSVEFVADEGAALDELEALTDSGEGDVSARASYELGERTYLGEPERAIGAFRRAVELLPAYGDIAQFHQRVGAACHFAARHEEALSAYECAQTLDFALIREFLIADCLFFAGRFRESRERFDEAVRLVGAGEDELAVSSDWILRRLILEDLPTDGRDFNAAAAVADSESGPVEWQQALDLDPLLARAAFNLALHNRNTAKPSFWLFLRAAVVYGDDAEAWLNALASCLNEEAVGFLPPIVESAVQHCGNRIAAEVRKRVEGEENADVLLRLIDLGLQTVS